MRYIRLMREDRLPNSLQKYLERKSYIETHLDKYHLDVWTCSDIVFAHVDDGHDRCPAELIILDTGDQDIYGKYILNDEKWKTSNKIYQVSMDGDADMCYVMPIRMWIECLHKMIREIK